MPQLFQVGIVYQAATSVDLGSVPERWELQNWCKCWFRYSVSDLLSYFALFHNLNLGLRWASLCTLPFDLFLPLFKSPTTWLWLLRHFLPHSCDGVLQGQCYCLGTCRCAYGSAIGVLTFQLSSPFHIADKNNDYAASPAFQTYQLIDCFNRVTVFHSVLRIASWLQQSVRQ